MNRQRVILAALLGVLAVCLLYAYAATPRLEKAPPRVESQRVRIAPKATADLQPKAAPERIDFSFLAVDAEAFPAAKRDIFRFGQRRAVPAESLRPAVTVRPAPAVLATPPSVPMEVVQQSLAQFTFLGFLEKNGEKTVFLASRGKLFLAKRGEHFGADREFLVADIHDNLLKIRHAGREALIEIPLIEQQKLAAAVSAPARMPALTAPGQPGSRVFPPPRRPLRPATPQENGADLPESSDESNPPQGQEFTPSGSGDVFEGEVNGTNQ